MHVALDGDKIVGLVNERGNGHISMLFVDGPYHRQGIATTLMSNIVCDGNCADLIEQQLILRVRAAVL